MIRVELTPSGVSVVGESVFTDPKKIQELIDQLAQAKEQLVENNARNAEEGYKELWESG
jgi:hypothetical protein